MPGRALPSRYSSEAPPPVEMCPNADSSRPSARTAAAESPPPTTVNPSTLVIASATPRVPAANGASSNTPIGPFQKTVFGPCRAPRRTRPPSRGPMSRPSRSAGIASTGTASCSASAANCVAATTSTGSTILPAARSSRSPAGVDHLLLEQRPADLVALRLEEREAHAAADQQRVDLGQQRLDHRQLVGDLRAAEHHHVRPLGLVGAAAPAPRPRAAPAGRRTCGSRAGTSYTLACLRCTAPKASSTYASANAASWSAKAPRSASSLLVSPGLKRRFSSRATCRPASAVDRRPGRTRRRCRWRSAPACRAARRAGPRPGARLYFGSGAPLGRPRWEQTIDRRPGVTQRGERRQHGPDPAVVGDRARSALSKGTFRSARTSTRRPETPSASRSSRFRMLTASAPTSLTRSTRRLE